jgi:hypothetical protein
LSWLGNGALLAVAAGATVRVGAEPLLHAARSRRSNVAQHHTRWWREVGTLWFIP